ncbi:transcriptional repressor [bacterium]|nr:MAG: transcriptional repressor [bacterium]
MPAHSRLPALIEKLRQHGHRITPQRVAILEAVTQDSRHPTVEQVYEAVRGEYPMTSLATVYKTIALMKEEGEILELGFGSGSSRFDGARPYPHPHLVCVECQRIIDLEVQTFDELPGKLADQYGFEIVSHRVDYYGICPDCRANSSSTR